MNFVFCSCCENSKIEWNAYFWFPLEFRTEMKNRKNRKINNIWAAINKYLHLQDKIFRVLAFATRLACPEGPLEQVT